MMLTTLLKQKLKMRRYFATQDDAQFDDDIDDPKISPITRVTGTS